MKTVKRGQFVEYSDDEQSYVVLVTKSVANDLFSGIIVSVAPKLGYDESSTEKIGEVYDTFHISYFSKIKNPFKNKSNSDIKPGWFVEHKTEIQSFTVLVTKISKSEFYTNEFTGIVVHTKHDRGIVPVYEIGKSYSDFDSEYFTRVKNPYKVNTN